MIEAFFAHECLKRLPILLEASDISEKLSRINRRNEAQLNAGTSHSQMQEAMESASYSL